MLNPVSLTESSIICNHVDSALGNNCNANKYKTLVLWVWQAYPGIVHVPERAWSEFGKSQLQLLSLSALVQTPILPMQWSVRSYGRRVACLCELSCKNGVPSRLQICNRERVGMGPPTLQISDKSVKICSHRAYRTKMEYFGRKHRFRTLHFNTL